MDEEEILEGNQSAQESDMVEQPEPLIIETRGKWQPFEAMTNQTFEVGKTYKIKVEGNCQFMISKDKPTFGFGTNEITYTKDNNTLWIKTGG